MKPIWLILIAVVVSVSIVGLIAYRLAMRAQTKQTAANSAPPMDYLIGDNNLDGQLTLADQM